MAGKRPGMAGVQSSRPLTLLLPHGFPSASRQYRRLIDALGTPVPPHRPGPSRIRTHRHPTWVPVHRLLADVTERFAQRLRLARFVLSLFDFGGPVGFRPTARHPGTVAGLMIQNANAYQDGLSDLAQEMIGNRTDVEGAEERIRQIGVSVVDQSPRLRVAVIGATRSHRRPAARLPRRRRKTSQA